MNKNIRKKTNFNKETWQCATYIMFRTHSSVSLMLLLSKSRLNTVLKKKHILLFKKILKQILIPVSSAKKIN